MPLFAAIAAALYCSILSRHMILVFNGMKPKGKNVLCHSVFIGCLSVGAGYYVLGPVLGGIRSTCCYLYLTSFVLVVKDGALAVSKEQMLFETSTDELIGQ